MNWTRHYLRKDAEFYRCIYCGAIIDPPRELDGEGFIVQNEHGIAYVEPVRQITILSCHKPKKDGPQH